MGDHPNTVLVRQAYEALARSDWDRLAEVFAPNCSLRVDGHHRLSGRFEGRSETLRWFCRAAARCAAGFSLTPLAISGIGSLGVAVEHIYATSDDAVLSVDGLRVFHVADGRIEAVHAIDLEVVAVASFWGVAPASPASSLQGPPRTLVSVTSKAGQTPGRDA